MRLSINVIAIPSTRLQLISTMGSSVEDAVGDARTLAQLLQCQIILVHDGRKFSIQKTGNYSEILNVTDTHDI